MPDADRPVPLVVDVDGTLIKSDLLHENFMQFVARRPLDLWRVPLWLAGGRHKLKCELADRAPLDMADIPLREETLARIRTANADGRPVYLASASETEMVGRLAERVGGITGVFGTDRTGNTAGLRKAEKLNAAFGPRGYDYIGDRPVDFGVWPSARKAIAVSHDARFARTLRRRFPDAEVIAQPRVPLQAYWRALRSHRWVKNALVFVPLLASRQFEIASAAAATLAFVCFCLAASSTYIASALLDLPGDRAHTRKRHGPFASGEVPIAHGVLLGAVLMVLGLGGSLLLPTGFTILLMGYVVVRLGNSLWLKRGVLIGVAVLTGLYGLRLLGGYEAMAANYSTWLLPFCLLAFLFLAAGEIRFRTYR